MLFDGTDEYLLVLLTEWLKTLPLDKLHRMGFATINETKESKRKQRKLKKLRLEIAILEDELTDRKLDLSGYDLRHYL